ncbi:MAG TPA: NUDIX domain-containing protein [candidate division Zixibacteria bacterium]|nr:NUDIX domain-containing protein [candidate division Zixibacteria bacterium]
MFAFKLYLWKVSWIEPYRGTCKTPLIRGTAENNKTLLVRSQAHRDHWAPPQEGMKIHESTESTVQRCLLHELGIGAASSQHRRSVWLGTRKLPRRRWDERELKYSLRGLVGKTSMIGKGYYAALVIIDSGVFVDPNPAEVYDWIWADAAEFYTLIATNPPDKKKILQLAWSFLIEE